MCPVFAIFDLSPTTLLIFGLLAVLLYGERLPEVAQSAGKWFMDFKRSADGLRNEARSVIDAAVSSSPPPSPHVVPAPHEQPKEVTVEAAPGIEKPS